MAARSTKANVQNTTLFGFQNHHSASKVTKPQFLCFRTLVTPWETAAFDPAEWGIDSNYAVKLQRTDETPINASLICLLQGIIDTSATPVGEWRDTKVQFEAVFGTLAGGVRRQMLAITDGQLQLTNTHQVKVIVECKRHERGARDTMITMQEAVLFVAWIREYPGYPNQRVLVSQDGMQVYLTFAETPLRWRVFLLRNTTHGNNRSFMRLHRFGPWDLEDADQVNEVVAILLAITK